MFKLTAPLALVLGLAFGAVQGAPNPMPRTITLERDCNGCVSGSRLALHADGQAQLTTIGKARLGTSDELCEGQVSIEDFKHLARLAKAADFRNLDDEIVDPEVQDGPWLTLRIDYADGAAKQVYRRGEKGPQSLTNLIDAIDATGRRIVFRSPQSKGEGCGFAATPR